MYADHVGRPAGLASRPQAGAPDARTSDARTLDARTPDARTSDARMLKDAIERRLEALAPGETAGELGAAMRHALLAPGKRLRPLLTLLACRELGVRDLSGLDAACAIEMVHAASLALDDLPAMDDAPRRRGRPATHVAFGEDAAILASVSLLAAAFRTVGSCRDLTPATRAAIVSHLAEAVGEDGLSGGQLDDLRGSAAAPPDAERLADSSYRKTGVLFTAAVEIASLVAGGKGERVARLRIFAAHLGHAFQLLDDLQDGPAGTGEDDGRPTLPSVLGPEEARQRLAAHVGHALASLQAEGALAMFVGQIFSRAEGADEPACGKA